MIWKIMIASFFAVSFAKETEPVCSKFHYEEQTLEKMIRQEIRVEQMLASIDKLQKTVDGAVDDLKHEKETLEIKTSEFEAVKDEVINNLERKLSTLDDRLVTPNVAFQSSSLKNQRPADGETLIFKNMSFNLGGGYDPSTGVFRAPNAGIYSFSLHLCLENLNSAVFYEILSSQTSILKGRLVNPSGSYYGCHSVNAPAKLQMGETVYVVVVASGISGKNVFWEHEKLTNQFSGFLVQFIG